MRKYLFILCAFLAYLLLTSKACDSDEKEDAAKQEAELTLTKVNIRNEFESDNLSRKSLRAFEVKAEQKLVDLADYLKIYCDKPIDESFRNQARQMILDLFISDSVLISTHLSGEKDEKSLLIQEYLKTKLTSGYISKDFIFDSIEVAMPLRRTDDLNYKGTLSFSGRVRTCTASDTLLTNGERMEVDIIASKVKKQFGTDTLEIWGVFLGDVR